MTSVGPWRPDRQGFGVTVGSAQGLSHRPCGAVVVQAEHGEAAQVEGGGAVVEPVVVFGDAAVADFPVSADQPGDGAFDHGPVLAVDVAELRCFGLAAGGA